jgi:branched-chain amino acid transport system ATP-binding protein
LAPLVAREIWAILRLVRRSGLAAIIVDKNYVTLSALADRLVVLVKGQVALEGATADLMREPEALRRHLGV